jgi:hypothetical protein
MQFGKKLRTATAVCGLLLFCGALAGCAAKQDDTMAQRMEAAASRAESAANKAESAANKAAAAAQSAQSAADRAEAVFRHTTHK